MASLETSVISSRIIIAVRDFAGRQLSAEVAADVCERACDTTGTELADALDPRGWVSLAMFHAFTDGLAPLLRGDFISDAVMWVVPARRELSSMSLTAVAQPSLFYRQLDRARGFYAKHVRFAVSQDRPCSAEVTLYYDDGAPRRRESCAVARGVLAAVPLLFGLPPASVEESACFADGADACRYRATWKRTGRHALLGFAIGLAIAAIGAVLAPSLWWLAPPLFGWGIGQLVIANQRRGYLLSVIGDQRRALASCEADLERRFREIQDLKATLTSVEKAQSEVLDAGVQALLGELVGEFAHEMSNPLSSVLFNLAFLESSKIDEAAAAHTDDIVEVEAVLGDIRYGIERMRGVLSWFVDVFRSGGRELGLISLDKEVEQVADLLRREWVGRISVHVELGPTPMIRSFGKEVVQVLINLLVNAAHATRRGNIWIKTARRGDRISLTIRDDGTGMSSETLERAFDRGFSTKSESGRGQGLGLYICRRITERNGGTITLESKIGEGTTATVTFPTADADDAPTAKPPSGAYSP